MDWKFRAVGADEVESEITQRDQFSNDDVGLVEALGREVTQNTHDAIDEDSPLPACLTFTFVKDIDPEYFRSLFADAEKHMLASGIDIDSMNWDSPCALIIEDFGTTGLTGSYTHKDNQNFSDFWRRHGLSHKAGKNLGRWGLGKLVYSNSSLLRTFFGLTKRTGDDTQLLMGQAVLSNHQLDDTSYAPHGFFAEQPDDIQVPITSAEIIKAFKDNFEIKRGEESGLSIIIPFPLPVITPEKILEVLILNYFFPIKSGQLVLEVDGEVIDENNVREMTKKYVGNIIPDAELLFDFIENVHDYDDDALIKAKASWHDSGKMSDGSFIPNDLEALTEAFNAGEMVGVRFRIPVTKSNITNQTYFDVFIQKPEGLTSSHDMYVRGSLLIPGERKLGYRKALGILLAKDPFITDFLADAENPAHTKWNGNAEKLKPYSNAQVTLRAIRNSVQELFDLLAHAEEQVSDDPLRGFFSIPGSGKDNTPKKKKKTTEPPLPPPPPIPKPIKVAATENGFKLLPDNKDALADLPIDAKVRAAYNRPDGAAFRKYNPLDFDFDKDKFEISCSGAKLISAEKNIIEIRIEAPDFEVSVSGFDDKREPVVKVQV